MKVIEVSQRSDDWLKLKKGKVTGTRLKKLMAKDWLSLVDEIVAELHGTTQEDDFFISKSMQHGIDFEPLAKETYLTETFTDKIHEVGFCISSEFEWLGLSPDGFIGSDGAIEIKCPDTSTHVKYIRQNKIPAEYFYQVICYFLVNEDLGWLDFVSFDNRFDKSLWIKRVTRKELENDIKEVKDKLPKFWEVVQQTVNKVLK
jgi:hypothetical protein